jgi:hypothetical protein
MPNRWHSFGENSRASRTFATVTDPAWSNKTRDWRVQWQRVIKRFLAILAIAVCSALVGYLAATRQIAEQRARELDLALRDAETRLVQLQADLDAANERLTSMRSERASASRLLRPTKASGSSYSGASVKLMNQTNGASPAQLRASSGAIVLREAEVLAPGMVAYVAAAGGQSTNFVRIEGSSSVHDWQVQGSLIGGMAQFPPGFPELESAAGTNPIQAKVSAFVPVRSLSSVEPSGARYSDTMDNIMYRKLRADTFSRIVFMLSSLSPASESGPPFVFSASGRIAVAGVTNTLMFPLEVWPLPDDRLQFKGDLLLKLSDFKINPLAPGLAGSVIRTADDIQVRFSWGVSRAVTAQAKAK